MLDQRLARSKVFEFGMVVIIVVVVCIIVIVIVIVIKVNLGHTCLPDPSNTGLEIIYKPSINNL